MKWTISHHQSTATFGQHMAPSLLFQLALVIMVPSFLAQSELKNANTTIETAISLGPNTSIPPESRSTWDSIAKGILRNLNKVLIELEINAFWYKDFIVFDYFEFVF